MANKQRADKPPRSPGRPKGAPNRTTAVLKDAILLAAEQVGENGNGEDGLTGYLRMVAKSDVKAFAGLIGKVLPMQVTGEGGGPVAVTFSWLPPQS